MGMSGHWRVDGVVAYETKTYAYGTKKMLSLSVSGTNYTKTMMIVPF